MIKMLSAQDIIKDLNETQQCLDMSFKTNNLELQQMYSEKMSKIVTWFMQNGYVQP